MNPSQSYVRVHCGKVIVRCEALMAEIEKRRAMLHRSEDYERARDIARAGRLAASHGNDHPYVYLTVADVAVVFPTPHGTCVAGECRCGVTAK